MTIQLNEILFTDRAPSSLMKKIVCKKVVILYLGDLEADVKKMSFPLTSAKSDRSVTAICANRSAFRKHLEGRSTIPLAARTLREEKVISPFGKGSFTVGSSDLRIPPGCTGARHMAGITKGRFAEIAAIIESRYEIRVVKTRRKPPRESARESRPAYNTREKETKFYMRITLICLITLRPVTT
ncbi:uncharacterized protein LOC114943121 [Nylanderia fulva]|uniref:uncharacterized protein LOC114943121 n=1 Tax=Nylanderia fulva TaxID=613905 RepID=UPI0010FB1AE3|nr:uncharacterized protein LOC114943121 [Nylanderia fulva]